MAISKRGVFFTIDSILAVGIIFTVIAFASSTYVKDQTNFNLNHVSQDLVKTLSTLSVVEIGNEYIDERISSGDITNLGNSVLEQIVEFWADDNLVFANRTASNVTGGFVSEFMGVGVWIDNEAIYARDIPIKKSLISSKKIISGTAKGQLTGETRNNPPTLFGPVIVEVRVWQ